ncbi:dTMP kinase [Legionella sp. km772]|uniref:dTMP kinase n=1 Tax=Legionella sp. km772 TaxID=2498111 RepID=UPI000F8EEC51|nr:dTMP kinase [Legionella sp. km772]RUR12143.1 dTMP kinase [Legionella sp. km772]
MSLKSGKLIVIEGLEGAGKSTAVATVVDFLNHAGIAAITTREPGGTEVGEQLRSIIKNPKYKDVLDDKSELLLLYTARVQLLKEVIRPALQEGTWVIADRFELSTMAYQGGGRELSSTMIKHLSEFCLNGFRPDLTLYLDLSPELGIKRAQLRGQFDRIEQQTIDFFHKVHKMYMQCIHGREDIVKIDATLPLLEVQEHIKNAVRQFLE